jgi:K(+)-stimulated pyrophosphate-energized sodium pump
MGAVPGGDRALAVLAVPLPDEVAPVTAISLTDATGRLLAGVGGTGADLFGSLACGAVASMALGAGVPQYATSRQQAITLPLLLIAAGLVAALGGVGLARALRRRAGGGPTRIVALAVTALFLVLAYGLVRALGFQIVDPTGLRVFRPTAPFWAVVFGVAAALLIGVANSLAVSRLRRLAKGVPPAERPALAAGAAVAPAVLVALAVWPSYFLGGLYCVGIAALGLTITVAANMALAVLAPILDAAAATGAPESGPNLPATGPARVLAARTAAMGQGMAVASAAVTALAALAAFASLVGLPEGTLDLLDAPVLPGLIIGVAVPFAFIAAIVAAIRRGAVLGAAEAERQLEAIPGLARGRASPDVGAAMSVAARAAARGLIAPALLAIVLPIVAGLVSLTFLGGLVAGAILVAFVLAAALTPAETTLAAAAPTLNSLARVMALVALALSAFLGGLHVVAVPTTSLLEHARPLLALLGG